MNDNSTILILDDDPDICMMIKMVLEYHGFIAIDTDSEEKAMGILSSKHVDLIIMDMLLSGANGTDVCRKIKSDPQKSSIPIVMFSAHPTARESCLAAGADDFISKPFEMNDLISKVHSFVGKNTVKQI